MLEPQRAGPSAEALPGAGEGELRNIAYAETLQEAEQRRRSFQSWARGEGLQRAAELIEEDWERMVSYYGYPRAHWRHLRTTNVIESPFAALRLRTDAAKRFKNVANATAVIWKMLLVAETKFRKLNAPDLLQAVWEGAEYRDGVRIDDHQERYAAWLVSARIDTTPLVLARLFQIASRKKRTRPPFLRHIDRSVLALRAVAQALAAPFRNALRDP